MLAYCFFIYKEGDAWKQPETEYTELIPMERLLPSQGVYVLRNLVYMLYSY